MIRTLPLFRWLNGEPQQRTGMALFQQAIGLSLVFRIVTEVPFADFLWGPHSLASDASIRSMLGPAVAPANQLFTSMAGTYAVLAALGLAAFGLLVQRATRISAVVACVTFNLLGARLPELHDGGDNLATLSLLYMMFLVPAGATAAAGSLRAWLHNLGALAICVQVCIVYFVAGFMKMYGDSWHNGTALYLISQVEWFSSPGTRAWFTNPLLATAAAYATMFFQVWFPLALFSRLKLAFLALAMFFHIGIAVTMGLLTFSVVMAGADLSLVTNDEYTRIAGRMREFGAFLRRLWCRRTGPATLFIDGDCAMCRAFGRRVAQLDPSRSVSIQSFHETGAYRQYGITRDQLEHRMHLVVMTPRAEVFAGFEVLLLLAWRRPVLWIAIPLLYAFHQLGLGAVLYTLVADRRQLFNRAPACTDRCAPPL